MPTIAPIKDRGTGQLEVVFPFILGGSDDATGRIATGKPDGSAVTIPATHPWGEALELRYSVAFTASQFQGIYAQVAAANANTSTVRGCEFNARSAAGTNIGGIEGGFFEAMNKGTGTTTQAFGVTGQVSMDADTAHTTTFLAAVRAKVQSEDAATITEGYGVYIQNEAVTGLKLLTAAIGVNSTSGATGFGVIIDASGTALTVNAGKVGLIKFKDSGGDTVTLWVADDGTVSVS